MDIRILIVDIYNQILFRCRGPWQNFWSCIKRPTDVQLWCTKILYRVISINIELWISIIDFWIAMCNAKGNRYHLSKHVVVYYGCLLFADQQMNPIYIWQRSSPIMIFGPPWFVHVSLSNVLNSWVIINNDIVWKWIFLVKCGSSCFDKEFFRNQEFCLRHFFLFLCCVW